MIGRRRRQDTSPATAVSNQMVTVCIPADAPNRFLSRYAPDSRRDYSVQEYTLTIDEAARLLSDLQAAVLG